MIDLQPPPLRRLLLFIEVMTDKSEENATITLESSSLAEPVSLDSTSSASSHFMHTVLWAPPDINHLIVPEDTLCHKLDTWHAGDLNLTWASTTAGMTVSLIGALCTASMPAFVLFS